MNKFKYINIFFLIKMDKSYPNKPETQEDKLVLVKKNDNTKKKQHKRY